MPITETDIKLMASARMDDSDDGGGRMSGTVIVDGEENNLFPDVSELDRVYGRVNLRKIFPAILTPDTDTYYGANLIVAEAPGDPRVHITLFTTESPADKRPQAQDYVERYVAEGPLSEMKLLGNHFTGQQLVLCYQRVAAALPEIGDVYVLSEEDSGGTVFGAQFVRILNVDAETVEYVDNQGAFLMTQLVLTLTTPLERDFPGGVPDRLSSYQPPTKIRRTSAVDAARYYGIRPTVQAANLGDLTVKVDSIFSPLVPATQGETPVLDVQAGGLQTQTITSGGEDFDLVGPVHTGAIPVDINNRGFNYVFSCQPIPAAGALTVEYRALGKWYRIADNGAGQLTGDGSGIVNHSTGSVAVTLAALPDVPSAVLFSWGSKIHYVDRAGSAQYEPVSLYHVLAQAADPGTMTISWTGVDTLAKTATVAANGTVSGDATGQVIHEIGEVYIQFAALPASNSAIQFDYDALTKRQENLAGAVAGQVVTINLANVPLKAGSVRLRVPYLSKNQPRNDFDGEHYFGLEPYIQTLTDDGLGGFAEDATATINYTTGEITFSFYRDEDSNLYADHAWLTEPATATYNGTVTAYYQEASAAPAATSESLPAPPLSVKFLPTVLDSLVPGTLRFKVGNQNFSDRAGQGVLYLDDDTVAGSIDYGARIATLTNHNIQGQPTAAIQITSLLSVYGDWTDYQFKFRTPGSPLQPGSLIINATADDGTLIAGTTDFNGNITGSLIEGTVDQENGIVDIRFGALVADSSLTAEEKAEWWYDPADIDGNGDIWKPTFVYPNTVRFNTVVLTWIPLDPDILGLDPVRLPLDGRVPIFRVGYVVVVHHTDTVAGVTPTAGGTVDLGRDRLSRVRVVDVNGVTLDPAQYTVNLDDGVLTWANPLDLAGTTGPYDIEHTVEDMALVTDAQINGTLTLSRAISHTFPSGETKVSSTLIFGDLWAHYGNLFEQQTWTGVWSDQLIGNSTTGQYNETIYPIAVRNDGAITERWRIEFTSTTAFKVVGETVGQIAIGDINTDLSPTNPATGAPYFTVDYRGWGAGWAAGNVVRFNTTAAHHDAWASRTIEQGPAGVQADRVRLQIRGDIDQ